MTTTGSADERIAKVVMSWPGVTTAPGNFGALSFTVGRREIGHLHGSRVAHFAFTRRMRAELLAAGRVGPHPVSSPGLAARRIEDEADVRDVIDLLRLNYDRLVARHGLPNGA